MTHIIYRIRQDFDHYQYFDFATKPSEADLAMIRSKCVSKKDTWKSFDVYIREPKLKQGNFYSMAFDHLIADQTAYDYLDGYFDAAGETFELTYNGNTYYYLNILQCIDCLDVEKSTWETKFTPKDFVFYPDRLGFPGFFKIPQVNSIFLYVDTDLAEDNVKKIYDDAGLEGVIFEEVWKEVNRI